MKNYLESVLKGDVEKVPTRVDRFVEINTVGDVIGMDMSETVNRSYLSKKKKF